ncbi:MAG TPA: conjugal transfer protein TraC, partial [Thermodesulfobacteriota bacterium]|nr:conjugal transfer protein TraC [Thermodesulfobacteriota bacterium]
IFENQKANLHGKCNFVLQQQAVGSFAPSLRRKQEEYMWATGEIEKGTAFIRIMPIMWHISSTDSRSRETSARAKRMWESQGFVVQKDRGILNVLFISSLPFGLINVGKNLKFINRDFICQPEVAVKCLPIQADFSGSGTPVNLFIGRKGQLATMDIFDKRASNNNALISAASGSGKSFLMNSLVFNYYSTGSLIRIIDIGQSYKKLCSVLNGNFITFSKESNITLNPFTNIIDINDDISSISSILAQMIYSTTQEVPDETEMTLIKNAIYWAYRKYSNEADVDRIYDYLKEFPRYSDDLLYSNLENTDDDSHFIGNLRNTSIKLAFNLQNFTSRGTYGKWFNGPSTLDIARDDFVILELEELAAQPELFGVITLQLINYVTSNLYLSDRSQKRLIIFDEAWRFFKEGSMLKNVIEDGYRRARKYGGSFTTITQSLLDLKMAGDVGDVIQANSAYKFYLESSDFEKAKQEKIIDYEPFVMDLLKSVQNRRPNYSEVFVDGPAGLGVMRLIVDPYSYYIYTSDADDNAKINSYVQNGMSYAEAINKMVANREV